MCIKNLIFYRLCMRKGGQVTTDADDLLLHTTQTFILKMKFKLEITFKRKLRQKSHFTMF
jgi:hypothetical protein